MLQWRLKLRVAPERHVAAKHRGNSYWHDQLVRSYRSGIPQSIIPVGTDVIARNANCAVGGAQLAADISPLVPPPAEVRADFRYRFAGP